MSSPDSLKNTLINLGIYYDEITKNIYKDPRFLELQQILTEPSNLNKYIYSLYSDTNLLAHNIFMPIFHSVYLGSGTINVVLESEKDLWLVEAFPNNKYFSFVDSEEISKYSQVRKIKSLREIGVV